MIFPRGYRRAPQPKADVSGTYSFTRTRVNAAGKTTLEEIGLLIATREVGLIAIATKLDSAKYDSTRVYAVDRWATNEAGDVILNIGSSAFDGWQTDDDGFVATNDFTLDNGEKRTAIMAAVPFRLPMSRDDGLYVAKVRTTVKAPSSPIDWSGDMAVAFAAGTMYVDLVLHNAGGGSTGFTAKGRLRDDAFDLSDDSGSRLHGTVRNGVIRADWVDQRKNNVAFKGSLVAERK